MKVRNEKQQQAYDMLQKLPQVMLVAKDIPDNGWRYEKLAFCIINDHLFVRVSDLVFNATSVMRKHFDAGEISKEEMIPVRNVGQRYGGSAIWVVSVGVIIRYETELNKMSSYSRAKINFARTYLDENNIVELNSYTLTEEQIRDAHFYYQERVRLLNEVQNDAAEKMRESRKPFEPIESVSIPVAPTASDADGLTLEQLVDRIESMGWTVTLHRKEGQPADAAGGQIPSSTTTPAVPSWYNDDVYQIFGKELRSLNLSFGTVSTLEHVGITTLGQIVSMTKTDLLRIKHFGKKKLTELDDMFEELGLEFGQDINKWHEARKAFLASQTTN